MLKIIRDSLFYALIVWFIVTMTQAGANIDLFHNPVSVFFYYVDRLLLNL